MKILPFRAEGPRAKHPADVAPEMLLDGDIPGSIGEYFAWPFQLVFFGARSFTSSLASWSLLPSVSSRAISDNSFSRPSTNNTWAYAPIVTFPEPFSIPHNVGRLMPAR